MATKVNFNKLATDAAIMDAITSLHNRSDTLQLDVHKVLVAIASRWNSTKDYRPAVMAVNCVLSKDKLGGLRTNAIRAWVEVYLGLKVIEEGDDKGKFMCPKPCNAGQHMNMAELVNVRWWEFKPEPAYKPLDFDKQWATMMKGAKDRVAKGLTPEDNVDLGMIEVMAKARAEYLANKTVQ